MQGSSRQGASSEQRGRGRGAQGTGTAARGNSGPTKNSRLISRKVRAAAFAAASVGVASCQCSLWVDRYPFPFPFLFPLPVPVRSSLILFPSPSSRPHLPALPLLTLSKLCVPPAFCSLISPSPFRFRFSSFLTRAASHCYAF